MRYGASRPADLAYWQSALCGTLAGCTAGTITTPLDVAKTRIMLAEVSMWHPLVFRLIFPLAIMLYLRSSVPVPSENALLYESTVLRAEQSR